MTVSLNAISEMMDEKLSGLKEDVGGLKEEMSGLKEEMSRLKEDVSEIKEDVTQLKMDVSYLKEDNKKIWADLTYVKGQMAELGGRQIEMNAKMDLMDAEVRGIRAHLENVTDLKIQLMAENIFPATSRYIETTKEVNRLREGFDLVSRVVRKHSEKLKYVEERVRMA